MSDSDTVYRVLTVYDADTSKPEHSFGRLSVVLDHAVNLMREAKGALSELVSKFVDLDAKMETSRVAIAGLFTAGGFAGADNFQTSLKMSSEMINKMIKDAAVLPGTAEDLQEIFQRALPGGSNSGKSLMQIEELAGKAMAVGKAFGMNANFIGQETAEMLEGNVVKRAQLFAKMRQFMGPDMTAQKFNSMSSGERFDTMLHALEKFNPMIKEYGNTWDAISSTTTSYIDKLTRIGSGALFKGLEGELQKLNDWYERNEDAIDSTVKKLGDELAQKVAHGFEAIKDAVGYIVDHRDTIISVAEALAAAWGVSKISGGGGFGGMLSGKGGSGVAGFLGGGALGFAMAHLTGETDGLSKASSTLLGAMSGLPGVIGAVSSALFGLQQFLESWIDNETRNQVMTRGDLGDPVSVYKRYEKGGSKLTAQVGNDMASFLEAHGLTSEGGVDTHKLMSFLMLGTKLGAFDVAGAAAFRSLALKTAAAGYIHKHVAPEKEFGPGTGDAALTPEEKLQQLLATAGRPVQQHVTNIGQIVLNPVIYDAEDPARVVQKLAHDIKKEIATPRQSSSASVHF